MNNELLGLRRSLLLSFVMIVIGVASLVFYMFEVTKIIHPFIGLTLLIAGAFLFRCAYLRVISLSFQDDGWEYLGDHCYCTERYKEGCNSEDREVDKNNPGWDGWIYLGDSCYGRKEDIEKRDEEIRQRAESEAYMKNNFPDKKEGK